MTETDPIDETVAVPQAESATTIVPGVDTPVETSVPPSPREIEAQRVMELGRVKQELILHLKSADLGDTAITVLTQRYERGQRTASNAKELVLSIYEGLRQKRDARSFSLQAVQTFAEQKGYFQVDPEPEATTTEVAAIASQTGEQAETVIDAATDGTQAITDAIEGEVTPNSLIRMSFEDVAKSTFPDMTEAQLHLLRMAFDRPTHNSIADLDELPMVRLEGFLQSYPKMREHLVSRSAEAAARRLFALSQMEYQQKILERRGGLAFATMPNGVIDAEAVKAAAQEYLAGIASDNGQNTAPASTAQPPTPSRKSPVPPAQERVSPVPASTLDRVSAAGTPPVSKPTGAIRKPSTAAFAAVRDILDSVFGGNKDDEKK